MPGVLAKLAEGFRHSRFLRFSLTLQPAPIILASSHLLVCTLEPERELNAPDRLCSFHVPECCAAFPG